MTDQRKAGQQANIKHSYTDSFAGIAKLARTLPRLQLGPVGTITTRSELNNLMPVARIKGRHHD